MKIWVDADACPKVIRETLIRAAERTGVECTFVANHQIPLPKRSNIIALQVPSGFDIADNEIVKRVEKGDLVITSDIPLADEVITKGALALSSRGELFTTETIKARLNIRDFLDTMRSSGIQTGGPNALSQTERREFANYLDRWLTRRR
ncbi:YaiI/YqxD family protein [Vibrio sp. 11986-1-5]|uniref:YaiI/YqxD family protein n=1 Tax=Vibrio sp. 11986-1-5 TaxID=2211215 RepID=UPI000D730829|nr:YaiI/YqxD family protein [Vibrio sp. 11986-1-5]PXA70234.1 YaiI/YqxD family protein [Vibrio sp. 11986-1-5]